MGNNELSGPVLAMQLANFIYEKTKEIFIQNYIYTKQLVQLFF